MRAPVRTGGRARPPAPTASLRARAGREQLQGRMWIAEPLRVEAATRTLSHGRGDKGLDGQVTDPCDAPRRRVLVTAGRVVVHFMCGQDQPAGAPVLGQGSGCSWVRAAFAGRRVKRAAPPERVGHAPSGEDPSRPHRPALPQPQGAPAGGRPSGWAVAFVPLADTGWHFALPGYSSPAGRTPSAPEGLPLVGSPTGVGLPAAGAARPVPSAESLLPPTEPGPQVTALQSGCRGHTDT